MHPICSYICCQLTHVDDSAEDWMQSHEECGLIVDICIVGIRSSIWNSRRSRIICSQESIDLAIRTLCDDNFCELTATPTGPSRSMHTSDERDGVLYWATPGCEASVSGILGLHYAQAPSAWLRLIQHPSASLAASYGITLQEQMQRVSIPSIIWQFKAWVTH